jgi:hypothetical protein
VVCCAVFGVDWVCYVSELWDFGVESGRGAKDQVTRNGREGRGIKGGEGDVEIASDDDIWGAYIKVNQHYCFWSLCCSRQKWGFCCS